MNDLNKELPPPLPEDAKKCSKPDFLEETLGIKNWKPPGKNSNPELTDFIMIDKETKNLAFHTMLEQSYVFQKNFFSDKNYLHIECMNGKIINKDPKFIKKYSKLVKKLLSNKNKADPSFSSDLCYELYAGITSKNKK